MKNIQIKVDDTFHTKVKVKATKDGHNISDIGRNLFSKYLKGEIDNGLQTFRHENKHG
jgi:hypothetical protein